MRGKGNCAGCRGKARPLSSSSSSSSSSLPFAGERTGGGIRNWPEWGDTVFSGYVGSAAHRLFFPLVIFSFQWRNTDFPPQEKPRAGTRYGQKSLRRMGWTRAALAGLGKGNFLEEVSPPRFLMALSWDAVVLFPQHAENTDCYPVFRWRTPWLRHFIGSSFGISSNKASTISDDAAFFIFPPDTAGTDGRRDARRRRSPPSAQGRVRRPGPRGFPDRPASGPRRRGRVRGK